jgi:hypothetical protein
MQFMVLDPDRMEEERITLRKRDCNFRWVPFVSPRFGTDVHTNKLLKIENLNCIVIVRHFTAWILYGKYC